MGLIPSHWEVRRNGRLFSERKEVGFPDLPILEVSLKTGVRVRETGRGQRKQIMSDRAKYKRAVRGDITYNMMRLWQGAVGTAPEDGLVSPAYVVAKPNADVDSRYYALLFRTDVLMSEVNKYSHGIVTDRNRLYWDEFKQMPSPFPPAVDRTAIVKFLAALQQTVHRTINAEKRLIALLNDERQVIIHRAVTCGVNDESLRSTESEWFPKLPSKWSSVPLRRVITTAIDGPHFSPRYSDAGVPFLSARNIKPHCWSLGDVKFINQNDYEIFSKRVRPERGDVLFTKGGTTGIARAVDLAFPFQVWVHVAVLKLKRLTVDPEYLAFALNSPRCFEQSQLFTRGATNQDLGLSRMQQIELPLPPSMDEQREIVARLSNELGRIDAALNRAQHYIDLSREYQARLMADVVTGQLDVRAAAERLPAEVEAPEAELESDADVLEEVPEDA